MDINSWRNFVMQKNEGKAAQNLTDKKTVLNNDLKSIYENDVRTFAAQGSTDPLGDAQRAVSQFRETVIQSVQLGAKDPLGVGANIHDQSIMQTTLRNQTQGKNYEELLQMQKAYAEGTPEYDWLKSRIRTNTWQGAQQWAREEPNNDMANYYDYMLTSENKYAGTPEEVYYRNAGKVEYSKKNDYNQIVEGIDRFPEIAKKIYESGMSPLDYFSSGKGTVEEQKIWQSVYSVDTDIFDPELRTLTKYANIPWDEEGQAIIDKYKAKPEDQFHVPYDPSMAAYDPQKEQSELGAVFGPLGLLNRNKARYHEVNNDFWLTKDEKEKYNVLYGIDPLMADEYYMYLEHIKAKREYDATANITPIDPDKYPVSATVGSWLGAASKPVHFLDVGGQYLGNMITGSKYPINFYRNAVPGAQADLMQQKVAENIDSDIGKELYGVLNSSANTLMAAGLGPAGGALYMAAQGADSKMTDLWRMREEKQLYDMTDDEIMLAAGAAGVFEYAFEKIGLDKLFSTAKNLGKESFKKVLKDVAVNAGVNAAEEYLTEEANMLYDFAILGENGEWGQKAKYYQDMGLTPEQTAAQIRKDMSERRKEAAIGGGLQGLIMGGGASAVSAYNTRSGNKTAGAVISDETLAELMKAAEEKGKGSAARKMAERMKKRKTISAMEKGRLFREVLAEADPIHSENMLEEVFRNTREQLIAAGEENADAVAVGVVDVMAGNELDNSTLEALAKSEMGLDMLRQYMPKQADETKETETEKTKETDKEDVDDAEEEGIEENDIMPMPWENTDEEVRTGRAEERMEEERDAIIAEEKTAQEITERKEKAAAAAEEAVKTGRAEERMKAERAVIEAEEKKARKPRKKVVEKEGAFTITNEKGETKDLQDADMDEGEKRIALAGANDESGLAEAMEQDYRNKGVKMAPEEAEEWAEGYKTIANAAAAGVKTVEEAQNLFTGALTDEEAKKAFETGKRIGTEMAAVTAAETEVNAQKYGYNVMTPKNQKQTGVVFGKVTGEINNAKQMMLKVIDQFAKEYGLQVQLYDSLGNANAKYIRNTNKIMIGLDAQHGALTRVVSHEAFHFIKQFNGTQAGKMARVVVDALQKKGMDVQAEIEKVKRQYENKGQEMTNADALEEIVADGMLDVIGTEENLKKIIQNDRTTAEKIRDWLQNAVEKLRSIMQKVAGKNNVVRALKDDAEYMAKIAAQFDAALKQAVKNYKNTQKDLYKDVLKLPEVQTYVQDMGSSTNRQQAQDAFDTLAHSIFGKSQMEWVKNHPDGDISAAIKSMVEAAKEYAQKNVFLGKALEDRGLTAPKMGSSLMMEMSYLGKQAVKHNFDAMREEDAGGEKMSLKIDEEQAWKDRSYIWDALDEEPALAADYKLDEDVQRIIDTFRRIRENYNVQLDEKQISRISKKAAERIKESTKTRMSVAAIQEELKKLYRAMNTVAGDAKTLRYKDEELVRYSRLVIRHAMFKAEEAKQELEEEDQKLLDFIMNTPFSLNTVQKSEVASIYGSVQAFSRKYFGKLKIRAFDKYSSGLENSWQGEWQEEMPGVFDPNMPADQMPLWLAHKVDQLWTKKKYPGLKMDWEYQATYDALKNILDFYDIAFEESAIREAVSKKRLKEGEVAVTIEDLESMHHDMVETIANMETGYEEKFKKRLEGDAKRRETLKEKSELRNRIIKNAKWLNERLLNNTHTKHIPDGLKGAVLRMMNALTENSGVFHGERLAEMRKAYDALSEMGDYSDSLAADKYDVEIGIKLQLLEKEVDGKQLYKLSKDQLEHVADIVDHMKYLVQLTNAIFIDERKMNFKEMSLAEMEVLADKESAKNTNSLVQKTISGNTTPPYFFKKLGGMWKKMFDDLVAGQKKWGQVVNGAKEFYEKTIEKYHADEWLNSKDTLRFTSMKRETLEMDTRLALSLYATWKRENTNKLQQAKHLRVGGFEYDKAYMKKKYKGVDMNGTHRLAQADIDVIEKWLGKDKIAFADEMVRYLSEDMAKLGNETSVALYGYKKFKEGYYFPYKSSKNFLDVDLSNPDKGDMVNALRGWGASKTLIYRANIAVTVGDFIDTWSKHINEMGVYNGFAVPVDNINRVYNYKERGEEFEKDISMKGEIKRVYGEEAAKYIHTLMADIAGGVTIADRAEFADKMISLFKKSSVAGSLSVAIQQPSAIMRAMALINPKYFVTPGNVVKEYKEMIKYSGTGLVKDIGRFDTGTGMSATEWITQKTSQHKVRDTAENILGWAPEKMDQMTWAMIWHAVKKETAQKIDPETGKKYDVSTEKGLKEAAKRFDEVINYTQVYDSVLSRSQMMRSKGQFTKMFTSFAAEPTVSFNMLQDAIAHRGDKSYVGRVSVKRAAAAWTASVMLNALLKSLITAGRKDDEKKTYAEKYAAAFMENFLNDLNPLNMIPGVRDVVSIFEGYDVERADMALISDLKDGVDVILKWINGEEVETKDLIEKGLGSVANLFGVPLRNIARDGRTMLNIFVKSKPLSQTKGANIKYGMLEGLPFGIYSDKNTAYYDRMVDAALQGDDEAYAEMEEYLTEAKGVKETTVKTGVRGKLKERFADGEVSKTEAVDFLEDVLKDKAENAYWTVDEWEEGGDKYTRFGELYRCIDERKSTRAAIKELLEHGTKKETIAGQITDEYKPKYKALYKTNPAAAADLKAYLLTTYEQLGYDRSKKSKDIDAWLTQK